MKITLIKINKQKNKRKVKELLISTEQNDLMLYKLDQDLNYFSAQVNNEEGDKFQDIAEKLASLKKLSPEDYIKNINDIYKEINYERNVTLLHFNIQGNRRG